MRDKSATDQGLVDNSVNLLPGTNIDNSVMEVMANSIT